MLVMVCQAVAKEQGCVDVLPCPVLEVVPWPIKPDCDSREGMILAALLGLKSAGVSRFVLSCEQLVLQMSVSFPAGSSNGQPEAQGIWKSADGALYADVSISSPKCVYRWRTCYICCRLILHAVT